MSQATLTDAARRHVAAVFANPAADSKFKPRFSRSFTGTGAGILKVSGLPTFRSGTFRDSMGFQHTWEDIHIEDMARNFSMLRDRELFPDVPVRDGHPGWLVSGMEGNGLVIGFHTGLSTEMRQAPHDLTNYNYLLADFEAIDPDAQDKIESGLWRSVSSEVGTYVTNNEAEFWPVYQGVAYVDIPAVEGLKGFSKRSSSVSVITMDQGDTVDPKTKVAHGAAAGTEPADPPAAGAPAPDAGDGLAPPAAAGDAPAGDAPAGDAPAGDAPAGEPDPEPDAQHAGVGTDGSFQFSQRKAPFGPKIKVGDIVNAETFAALVGMQAHTAIMEGVVADNRDQSRKDFVLGLVNDDRLLASLKPQTELLALSLSDDQFSSWSAVMSASPKLGLLQQHGDGTTNHEGDQSGRDSAQAAEKDTLAGILKHHKDGGMKPDKIMGTPSYKRMLELDPSFKL